jgi:WD40 repeat protein
LDTGKLMAGPFGGVGFVGAVRFSQDSKKLAVYLESGTGLDVWDVQTQKLYAKVQGKGSVSPAVTHAPLFWTNKETILAAFNFTDHEPRSIYEFDVSTVSLETVGASFKGHTNVIDNLALSPDGALVASASRDDTIKFWAFESHQLLASFHVLAPSVLIFSPDSRQLAYASRSKICICNIPTDILASIVGSTSDGQSTPLDVGVRFIFTSMLIHMLHCSPTQHVVVLLPCAIIQ